MTFADPKVPNGCVMLSSSLSSLSSGDHGLASEGPALTPAPAAGTPASSWDAPSCTRGRSAATSWAILPPTPSMSRFVASPLRLEPSASFCTIFSRSSVEAPSNGKMTAACSAGSGARPSEAWSCPSSPSSSTCCRCSCSRFFSASSTAACARASSSVAFFCAASASATLAAPALTLLARAWGAQRLGVVKLLYGGRQLLPEHARLLLSPDSLPLLGDGDVRLQGLDLGRQLSLTFAATPPPRGRRPWLRTQGHESLIVAAPACGAAPARPGQPAAPSRSCFCYQLPRMPMARRH
ncbi:unnamed protein product [Prorocentrum cordatum]|uniref:Uncharacterized protein n=1 Tax=Prorocentrum cordatum TaxID=2364126 RepID=A0ABN9VAW5_9DINO|nr:unnamed protein product [Polarella glacialis]